MQKTYGIGTFSHMKYLIHMWNNLFQNFTSYVGIRNTCFTCEMEDSLTKINFTCVILFSYLKWHVKFPWRSHPLRILNQFPLFRSIPLHRISLILMSAIFIQFLSKLFCISSNFISIHPMSSDLILFHFSSLNFSQIIRSSIRWTALPYPLPCRSFSPLVSIPTKYTYFFSSHFNRSMFECFL